MSDTVHPAITDPHVRAHLARLAAQAGTIPSGATDADGDDAARIAELRANPSWVRLPDDEHVESIDTDAEGLALRLYRPRAGHRGTLVFAHGGGWVAGNLDNNDALCRALAVATGTQVLSVDYRLAPEHPFPAGLDDLDRALRFASGGAGGLIDPALLGVAGHSAGGNLAAALALRSREGRAPGIRIQVLLCPVLDAPDLDRPSYRAHTDNLPLTAKGMRWYWEKYLRDADVSPQRSFSVPEPDAARGVDAGAPAPRADAGVSAPESGAHWGVHSGHTVAGAGAMPGSGADGIPIEAAPLRSPELTGSAPAVIVAAAVDPLSDEAEEYAERLTASGVPVDFVRRAGVPHLFLVFPSTPARDEVLADIAPAVRRAFA
ncbi:MULTISPECIES: alpha/beta hydrolase [Microbacterium]|uniref:alpha/beta hydrolase n=1 Tax=Microbacterium TaxID=33882 RepID=UPI00278906B3|nr:MULTISPECIES: alpha/beta hydrolase [Microbacterium]MDQ1082566.1 acetyl esterase [Microbacterium sp. SORGH_AS_0344]MDQ1168662.1 acetyl esterase [Microbacterium proteolyticum]